MRPKLIILTLLAGAGLMGMAAFLSNAFRPRPLLSNPPATNVLPVATQPFQPGRRTQTFQPAPQSPAVPSVVSAKSVGERIEELQMLAMNDDTNSLSEILSELTNPNHQIRKAALDAVLQFGGHSAIPRLQELAGQTEDTRETTDLLAAIEFLKLPSLMDSPPGKPGRGTALKAGNTNRLRTDPFDIRSGAKP